MDVLTDSLSGWSLVEAMERTSDPDLSVGHEAAGASRQKIALWERLSRGELVATGCFDIPSAPRIAIDSQNFLTLDWFEPPSRTLVGVAGLEVEIFNVQVFPVLRAPNAANYLNGLSLSESFRRYVIGDPEVAALAKPILKTKPGEAAVFVQGQAPGLFIDFHWPLDLTASALAFRFVDLATGDLRTPSAAISAVSEVLADRIAALRDILSSGRVVAFGTFAQNGIEGPIGRLQWTRSDISIDVSNGDLCEGEDHRAVPKWTGLGLRLPDAALPSNQPNGTASKLADVPRKAKAKIQTKEKPLKECFGWLETIMSNPEILPRSRDDLWAEAQSKWPGKFTERAFRKTREYAIMKTEAWVWKAPGPKSKSSHS